MNCATGAIGPERMEVSLEQIRFLLLPDRGAFTSRAERFRHLSHENPLGKYFLFLADVADAQQLALECFPPVPLPNEKEQIHCHRHSLPLLSAVSWSRDPSWRTALRQLLEKLQHVVLPADAANTVKKLQIATDDSLEESADRILSGKLGKVEPAELPLIAAALQVYWLHMVSSMEESAFGQLDQAGVCPVCGGFPNVGMVSVSGAEQGLRYLCCSLCTTRWHFVRLKCNFCESTQGLNYHVVDGSNGAIKIESCEGCNSYLKLLYVEKDHLMDATADDLGSLTMDILMGNEGMIRRGVNLLFHPGFG